MPQYFMASAYLMDTYGLYPLCSEYDNPMYTKEMQDLLKSTMDDYDPNLVIDLDGDSSTKDTNFAVFSKDVIIINYVDGKNNIQLTDESKKEYTVYNASSEFLTLKTGDIFAYPYDDSYLIIKIEKIQINGTTLIINQAEINEINDVFDEIVNKIGE